MPDGETVHFNTTTTTTTTTTPPIMEGKPSCSSSSSSTQHHSKDPRSIARKYQLELCKKAMEENVVVYLGTGCGKTHIAVLLIYEMGHLIKKPHNNICVFLAPTNALVEQQARVIEDSIDFKVGVFCGGSKKLRTHQHWQKMAEDYEIFVMTPQLLLRSLYHCFIKMESISLLVLDECHHAQIKSNHPYAEIMKVFYKSSSVKPRIFGMTASPVVGKGASSPGDLPKIINSLEDLLDSKVYSVEDTVELERYVASPVVRVYHYVSTINDTSNCYSGYYKKLEELKQQCISMLGRTKGDHQSLRSTKKLLARVHDNMIFCLENLGLLGALQDQATPADALNVDASRILLSGDPSERSALVEADENITYDLLCDRYLTQVAESFASACTKDGHDSDLSCIEVLTQPFFSSKLLCLIGILSTFRSQPDMKCIIFVNRIVTAQSLSFILQHLEFLTSWKCNFLVGIHAGLKSMSRKSMNAILEKFRSGELNLLIATKVGEEGLDIQTCCLVIRFDLPETVSSFIQSRGRARMPQSEYAFLVDSGNQRDLNLIDSFKNDESRMNVEIADRSSNEIFPGFEDRIYKVDSSGASISSGYSVSLLHHYCSKLPHDEYFDPKPKFYYFDDQGGTVCHLILPSNAALHQVVSLPHPSTETAKKDACLKAIEELHKLGVLTDFLLPQVDDMIEEESDVNGGATSEDKGCREELCEMVVPAALKEAWAHTGDSVHLNSYYIKLIPVPQDRAYKKFGLFLKASLPQEAERMDLDLNLAHGRYVEAKLVPAGVKIFDKDEMLMAQHFQEMFLKVILDRSEFIQEYVPLGKNDSDVHDSSTFYLLLPVLSHDYLNTMSVDWKLVRKCLSSPIFRAPTPAKDHEIISSGAHLHLANGCWSINDIENSLGFCPQKNAFFFVTNIVWDKNGYSPYKDSDTTSHVDHCYQTWMLELKILGFSKDIGSSLSLLPSLMHHLQNLLVAIELKQRLCVEFPEAAEVTIPRVLEALTTEKCMERFSLERLEILGDSFLKFVVGRHFFLLHTSVDEGHLTSKRSNAVSNSNLVKLATKNSLQAYIRDQSFDPSRFFPLGRPCPVICTEQTEASVHCHGDDTDHFKANEIACNKGHIWLHKKTIADVVEALIGAFLVDGGFRAATAFLKWIGIPVDFDASHVIKACLDSQIYMPLAEQIDIGSLENLLGYNFRHKGLLLQAFRLEFLGDAVVDYLITSYLFSVYPKLKPGHLTDLRSVSVSNQAFANVAVDRSFHKYLLCDSDNLAKAINTYANFTKTSSSQTALFVGPKCPKALGDVVESCLGAIFLDTGFNLDHLWKIMLSFLDPTKAFSSLQLDPIREIYELCASHNLALEFSATKTGKSFLVEAKVSGGNFSTTASASNTNKKDATKTASHMIYLKLKAEGFAPKCKSLEEILKSTAMEEAILIGFNEQHIDIAIPDENLKMNESPVSNQKINDMTDSRSPTIVAVSKRLGNLHVGEKTSPTVAEINNGTASQAIGTLPHKSAKQRLYELCAANCWKPPLFEVYREEGLSHLKSFTSKVVLEIEEEPDKLFEAVGEARTKKKNAEESVSEALLWLLDSSGYNH
ncbi:hypothetical protein ACFE04_010495 [Oxalis oulophora]